MEFKWTNKVDNVDDILAEDVNSLANAIITLIDEKENISNTIIALIGEKENISNKGIANGYAPLDENIKIPDAYLRAIDDTPTEGSNNPVSSGGVYTAIGDIETALDGIIAIQNELIGGDAS